MLTWLKLVLWIGVVLLPGGLLLLPVIYALHRREGRGATDAGPVAEPGAPSHAA